MINKRQEVEDTIINAIKTWDEEAYGYHLSFRELSARAGNLPLGTVHRICKVLREEGRIAYTDRVSRSLRVTGK